MLYHIMQAAASTTYHDVFRYTVRMAGTKQVSAPLTNGWWPGTRRSGQASTWPAIPSRYSLWRMMFRMHSRLSTGAPGRIRMPKPRCANTLRSDAITGTCTTRDRCTCCGHTSATRRSTSAFSFHHAILDGWSVATLISELLLDYLTELGGPLERAPAAPQSSAPLPSAAEISARSGTRWVPRPRNGSG